MLKLFSGSCFNAARCKCLQGVNRVYSFRLENETIDQPDQKSSEAMDTTPPDITCKEQTESSSSDEIEVIEITLSSPEQVDSPTKGSSEEVSASKPNAPSSLTTGGTNQVEVIKSDPVVSTPRILRQIPPAGLTEATEQCTTDFLPEIYRRGGFSFSSNGSDESCTAYFSLKVEAWESAESKTLLPSSLKAEKQSESEKLELLPVTNVPCPSVRELELDKIAPKISRPTSSMQTDLPEVDCQNDPKKCRLTADTSSIYEFSPAVVHPLVSGASRSSQFDHLSPSPRDLQMPTPS